MFWLPLFVFGLFTSNDARNLPPPQKNIPLMHFSKQTARFQDENNNTSKICEYQKLKPVTSQKEK